MQTQSAIWGLIATEWLLILPSALIFLRIRKLPARQILRLRWPGGKVTGLAILIGFAASLFVLWLGSVITTLFGYTFSVPPGLYPQNAGEALLLFFAMVVSAPICEETLFRGVIQRGYERLGPLAGILSGGLLFAIYHLSFQRLIILIPIAMALGYTVWRSNSLVTSILVHASYNSIALGLTITNSFRPDLSLDFFGSLTGAILGLIVATFGIYYLRKDTTPVIDTPIPEKSSWLNRSVPLALAIIIFLFLAGSEFVLGKYPQVLANNPIRLSSAPWQTPITWNYELRNGSDETVGEAHCSLQLKQSYFLNCQIQQQAFQTRKGKSYYQTDAYTAQRTAHWDLSTLELRDANESLQGDGIRELTSVSQSGEGLILSTSQNNAPTQILDLPANSLLMGEWPWRLSAMSFQIGYIAKTPLAWPNRYSQENHQNLPSIDEAVVTVQGAEPLATPAGNFIAWKVILGNQTAWYDTRPPHTLLRYDDGIESYLLSSIH